MQSIPQLARKLDVPYPTLYGWLRRGLLPTVTVGQNRVAVTDKTASLLRAVLETEGSEGVRRGLLVSEN